MLKILLPILFRSPVNNKLFIVKERDDAMESALNQFELFADKPVGAISVSRFSFDSVLFIRRFIIFLLYIF